MYFPCWMEAASLLFPGILSALGEQNGNWALPPSTCHFQGSPNETPPISHEPHTHLAHLRVPEGALKAGCARSAPAGVFHSREAFALAGRYLPLRQVRTKASHAKQPRGCAVAHVEPRPWAFGSPGWVFSSLVGSAAGRALQGAGTDPQPDLGREWGHCSPNTSFPLPKNKPGVPSCWGDSNRRSPWGHPP